MKKRIALLLITFLISFLNTGMKSEIDNVEPYDPSTHFISFSEPRDIDININPLDYAGKRIGLDVRHFELPRAYEGYYRLAARFPIIDYVSNNPLYMKQWSEDVSERISLEHRENGINVVNYVLEVLRETAAYPEIESTNYDRYKKELERNLTNTDYTDKYKNVLIELLTWFCMAQDINRHAITNLNQEDIDFFKANPEYFIAPDGKRMPSVTGDVSSHFKFIEHSRWIRYEFVFYAAKIMSDAIDKYVKAIKDFKQEDFISQPTSKNFSFEIDGSRIVIAGYDNDTHIDDADFIIDLGGNDIYKNSIASGFWKVSVAIDHSGNDRYETPDAKYVQGFGFIGSGFLVDLSGNDIYLAWHYSQGAGINGVGVLWDRNGDDKYDAHALVQGAAMFGAGILLDSAGEDFYSCGTLGQGGATTLGLGVLSDLNGDDRYHLSIDANKDNLGSAGYGQGGALSFRHYPWKGKLTAYGGVGMLVDSDGNDRYRTAGWCDQGGSYIMSLGVLYDGNGNDHYTAGTGQGSGIHVTNAILIDKNGNDIYDGGFRTGASGGDRTPGFLIDYNGNDIYNAGKACYGTACKPFAYSLFIDYNGNDTYIANTPKDKITMNNWESFSGTWPESEPYLLPYAICLDLNGDDDYQVMRRTNNSEYTSFGHGIHIDMKWDKGDIIGEVKNPLNPVVKFDLPESVIKSRNIADIRMLQNPDLFARFQAIGRIVDSGREAIPALVDSIIVSPNRQFNRDAMECIHYFFADKKVTDEDCRFLTRLLDSPDPEVRIIIADDFGIWQINNAIYGLSNFCNDTDPQVRRFALKAYMDLKSNYALPYARDTALNDPSEDVRRIAARYISRVSDEFDSYPKLERAYWNEPSTSVKTTIVESIGYFHDIRSLDLLRDAAKSDDYYLKRAAGKALAELYQVEGIEILIDSLNFPSIDAFYNYDRNVPNFISAYAGHDFSEAERYDQELWRKWFNENKDKIDIKKNADAFRSFTKLTEDISNLADEEQILKMEEFLSNYPDHGRVKRQLAEKLNSVAWNMVTSAPDQPSYDPKKGLEYAKRASELSGDPNHIDTLAEAYFVNGMFDECEKLCKEMLEKYPGNRMFLEKLERIGQSGKSDR